jgi:hypothetical protein
MPFNLQEAEKILAVNFAVTLFIPYPPLLVSQPTHETIQDSIGNAVWCGFGNACIRGSVGEYNRGFWGLG